jgi:hypothetical protein
MDALSLEAQLHGVTFFAFLSVHARNGTRACALWGRGSDVSEITVRQFVRLI